MPPAGGDSPPTSCPTTGCASPAGSSAARWWSSNGTSPLSVSATSARLPGIPRHAEKIERSHQTTKRWLARQRPARTEASLQAQLDAWLAFYNHQRPHRALQGATPAERWAANPADCPGPTIPEPQRAERRRVNSVGALSWDRNIIAVGAEHAGRQLLVIGRHDHVAIFSEHGLVHRLTIDPTRRYQPSGRSPGRRTRKHTGPCH